MLSDVTTLLWARCSIWLNANVVGRHTNGGWEGTVILGLLSFMTQDDITAGSIKTTDQEKKALAKTSWAFNAKVRALPVKHCL